MFSSILKTSSSITSHKTINAPPDQVLQILHDPQILIKSNPLVSDFKQDPNDPLGYSYIVTDDLTIFFLGLAFKTTSRYRCTFAPREDGMDTDVYADLGTRTSGHFTIKGVHDQGRNEGSEMSTQLVYVAEVEVCSLFGC
jgi:carbon monoxide dehydrogenase subunit G